MSRQIDPTMGNQGIFEKNFEVIVNSFENDFCNTDQYWYYGKAFPQEQIVGVRS